MIIPEYNQELIITNHHFGMLVIDHARTDGGDYIDHIIDAWYFQAYKFN